MAASAQIFSPNVSEVHVLITCPIYTNLGENLIGFLISLLLPIASAIGGCELTIIFNTYPFLTLTV